MFPFTIYLFIKQLTKPSVHDYQQCGGFLQINSTTFFLSLPFRRIIYHPKNTCSALTCLCPTVQPWLISQNKISLYIQILMFSYSLCLNNLDVSSCLNKVTQWHYNVLLYISVGRKTTPKREDICLKQSTTKFLWTTATCYNLTFIFKHFTNNS